MPTTTQEIKSAAKKKRTGSTAGLLEDHDNMEQPDMWKIASISSHVDKDAEDGRCVKDKDKNVPAEAVGHQTFTSSSSRESNKDITPSRLCVV